MSRSIIRFSTKLGSLYGYSKKEIRISSFYQLKRKYSDSCSSQFGFIFDIDGVIVRGNNILPGAKEAFRLLTDDSGEFTVPSIFLTNASNCMRHEKAERLSHLLDVHVKAEQVVMSHSPLLMFQEYMDSHVLVSGQGPAKEIARCLGFNNVSSIDDLRAKYPYLDMVDHNRRLEKPSSKAFPKIDVILLLGEPIRWETNLQLIIDCLVTNGQPNRAPRHIPRPHIPLLACNMDLLWVADAPMPRFGHGCFLHCLEALYAKITGSRLVYTALVGKPSELTYQHAENVLQCEAARLNLNEVKHIYAIGDNPDTDIFGANLYDRLLARRDIGRVKTSVSSSASLRSFHQEAAGTGGALTCSSMLVCTGIYSHHVASAGTSIQDNNDKEMQLNTTTEPLLTDHNHRDFDRDDLSLKKPTFTVDDVLTAVKQVFRIEHSDDCNWWRKIQR